MSRKGLTNKQMTRGKRKFINILLFLLNVSNTNIQYLDKTGCDV